MNIKKRIYLSPPHIGNTEQKYIKEAFETNWIAPLGANVDAFERALEDYCNIKHVAALSSGTAALHLALILLGITSGDEVIVSTFTFSASVNPILYQGARPIFIDSEPGTWNMDPALLERAIEDRRKKSKGKNPKAIIIVHLYGMPADMDAIMEIANRFEIPVIEDAAEALGSTYRGKKLGTFGMMGILSFNGNKIITTSGGGALISDNKELIEKAKFLATQARDVAPHYQHSQIGYNYRMSNVLAGIGRGQMEVIKDRVKRRRDNFFFYKGKLKNFQGIHLLGEPSNLYFSNYWLTTILLDSSKTGISREKLMMEFGEENIETRPLWKPMHKQPVFESYPVFLNGYSEFFFDRGLCLPSGSNLSIDEKDRIIYVINRILSKKNTN